MKKLILLISASVTFSCNEAQKVRVPANDAIAHDTLEPAAHQIAPKKEYSNERFREVSVENIGDGRFRVTGKAQVFESAFSWSIEDGHNEIKSGHEMTDAGAPAWGNFDFAFDVQKARENSTLTLILFEASAKDGSRQFELPIALN